MTTQEKPFAYGQKKFALDQVGDMARAVREDGFALVPDVLSPAEVAALREATDCLRPFGLDHATLTAQPPTHPTQPLDHLLTPHSRFGRVAARAGDRIRTA